MQMAATPPVHHTPQRLTPWRFAGLLRQSVSAWLDDAGSTMGAAVAYYTLFSVAPLVLIVVSIAGLVFGQEASRGAVVTQLATVIGRESATAVEGLLQHSQHPASGVAGSIVGVMTLLFGATSVVAEIQADLDRVWRVPPEGPVSGVVTLLRARLLSFGLILALGFLLLVSLMASAALTAIGTWWAAVLHGWGGVLQTANVVAGFVLSTILFALIYKILPRARIAWSDVWMGAAVTSLLFSGGKLLIGFYVGYASVTSPFGAAGSVVLVMVWVYYSAQIFLLGAEFTWLYAHAHGSRVGIAIPPARVR